MSIDRFRDAYWVELAIVALVAVVLGVSLPRITHHTMMGATKGGQPYRPRQTEKTRGGLHLRALIDRRAFTHHNLHNGISEYPSPIRDFRSSRLSVTTNRSSRALPAVKPKVTPHSAQVVSGIRLPHAIRHSLGPLSNRGDWPNPYHLNPKEILMIAHLVQAEAGNQSFVAQVAVAAVVLNRLNNPGFPKTVPGVLFAPGQFETVSAGTYWNTPSPLAILAARAAASGWDPSHGALYFYNPSLVNNSWMNTLPTTVIIGAQVFAR